MFDLGLKGSFSKLTYFDTIWLKSKCIINTVEFHWGLWRSTCNWNNTYWFKQAMPHYLLSFKPLNTSSHQLNSKNSPPVLLLGTKFRPWNCLLLLWMARMDMDWNFKKLGLLCSSKFYCNSYSSKNHQNNIMVSPPL